MRVANFLNVIGKESQDMFKIFNLSETDHDDTSNVLQEFKTRCAPITNAIYERYVCNKQTQEQGELLNHYLTNIIKQADLCTYGILKDVLIRDRPVNNIKGDRIRETANQEVQCISP